MSDFDWEEFLGTQISIPVMEDIGQIEIPEEERIIIPKYESELMKNYLAFNKLTQQHIDVYNQFLKKAANIICSKVIPIKDGRTIHFDKLSFKKPYYRVKNVEHKLFPQHARHKLLTYDADWSVILYIKKNDKIIYTSKSIVIAKCPVMLFSDLCHLTGLNAAELIKMGEDPLEQGGYFIIVGVEKILMLEEKLATNRIFIMNSPPKVKKYMTAMKLTTNTNKGTFLNEIIFNINSIMKYSFQSLRKKEKKKNDQFEKTKKLNIVYVYQLFSMMYFNNKYCYTNEQIIDLIKPFLIDQKSIWGLYTSLAEPSSLNKDKSKKITAIEIITKKMGITNLSVNEKKEEIKKILKTVYEHIQDIDPYEGEKTKDYEIRIIKTKIQLLSLMVARYLDHLAGIIPLDDRDDWSNKRVEGPGRKMEQLMRISWNKVTKDLVDHVLREDMKNEEIEKSFHGSSVCETITKIYKDSFIKSKWGLKGSNQKNNATQTLNRDNLLASLSHLNTINVNIQRNDKKMNTRMVQPNQYRVSCYVFANEGESCLKSDTKVLLSTGKKIAIGDLKNGDEVLTIDPLTLKQTPSKIYNHFIKSTEEYGKPVVKITTFNGREIICTDDHPFLTQHDWVYAKDLNIKDDQLVIYPSVQAVSNDVERKLILDRKIMKEKLTVIGVKKSLIDKHIDDLTTNKLLPLYSDDERLPTIARVAGFTLTDGSLSIDKNNRVSVSYCFGTEYDGQLFLADMKSLGYTESKLSYYESTTTDKKTLRQYTQHIWCTAASVNFASLLLALDLTYGNRIIVPHKPVPEWIMNGSLLVKREFVAGYQGGDGGKMSWTKRHDKVKAGKFNFPATIKNKNYEHINSLVDFMNQLVDIFTELDIKVLQVKTSSNNDSVDKEIRHKVEIKFSDEELNIIKYMEMVGYRYATTKSTESYHISEYLKYKHNKIAERISLKNIVNDLYRGGMTPTHIAKKLNMKPILVTSIVQYKGNGGTLAPLDTIGFEEWLKITRADKNCVFMPIKSIEPHEHCMVSDFTTESNNHSMIADGFVAHNCGLVKKLAITTKLTLDRGIEGDRIIMVLIYQFLTTEKTLQNQQILMLNGKPMGWCHAESLREKLIDYRRAGEIYYDTSFYIDSQFLYIDCSPSRIISPVLIVDVETQKLIIDLKNITDLTPQNLILEGAMEYISTWEEQNLKIAMDIEHLYNREKYMNKIHIALLEKRDELSAHVSEYGTKNKEYDDLKHELDTLEYQYEKYTNNKPFTHCEISGRAALGVSADMIPFMQHNQAPRNIYQCLWKEETVMMADGSKKPIKNVKVGDKVVTFDPITFENSITKVVHHYVRKTDKLIYRVTTESGREIVATEDHKFMTSEGWCEVKDIKDKLIGIWVKNTPLNKNCLFVSIKSVELVDNCEISDITVESENHSFIAGDSFMSANCTMGTQAVGNPHLNYKNRFDGTFKVLESPTPPIVKTDMYDTLGLAERGMGQNVNIIFKAEPGTEEDAFTFNEGSIDRGLFRMVKYFSYKGKIKISDPNIKSYFGLPDLKKGEDPSIYENLNEHGLPIIGSYIKEKQCVIGIIKERNGIKHNASVYLMYGEKGIVDDISFHETPTHEIIEVKLRITRKPKIGDKYAARMAQKGTIGKIKKHEDMPYDEITGMTADIIVNSSVIPSRMTISYLMELIAGKAASYYGETVNASAFEEVTIEKFQQMLAHIGLNPKGYSRWRDGETGRMIDCELYSGIVYFQALKHQPEDKISVRSLGAMSSNTRQPVKGRQLGGGLRFGEMESDTYLSHGASAALKERLCNVSDKYKMAVCKKCATTSPFNDIDQQFHCPVCDTTDAGALTLTYITKYQNQLLMAMGIKPNFILNKSIKNVLNIDPEIIEEDKSEEETTEESSESSRSSEEEISMDDDQISGDNDDDDDM